ncbi:MAG: nitrogen regulation protein NR(I) [Alphaproteobacteria bacterium]
MNTLAAPRTARILVADDDQGIRTVLLRALARLGHDVETVSSAASLWRKVTGEGIDLLVTDVVFPDGDALELLPRVRKARPELPVIVMSARSTLLTAVRASERGAFDYLPKPFDLNLLIEAVQRALAPRRQEPSGAAAAEPSGGEALPLIGQSAAMQEVFRVIARLTGNDLTVLITGESGTGKELIARALHAFGKRRDQRFVAVNMAAIPRELVESELFGHERGAFTGAIARKAGRFEEADGGTLFLDEVGDMPMEAQTRLLRVLQDGEFTAVGGRVPIKVDVRIIAATHRNLRQMVGQGLFREDLFYRLNVVPISVPPLRERRTDIPLLVRAFLDRAAAEGLPHKTVSPEAMARLSAYAWPGNVRELGNLARRLAALHGGDEIGPEAVDAALADAEAPPAAMEARGAAQEQETASLGLAVEQHLSRYFAAHGDALPPSGLYDRVLREMERPLLSIALAATRGNQVQAAKLLGVNRNTLRKKIRDLELHVIRDLK